MLSDRNIFCPLGGGEKQRGPMPLGRFLFQAQITQRGRWLATQPPPPPGSAPGTIVVK